MGGVFLVVLIAAAMLLAGLAIYYHNKVGGYTEENAAYREAADRMMATAFSGHPQGNERRQGNSFRNEPELRSGGIQPFLFAAAFRIC